LERVGRTVVEMRHVAMSLALIGVVAVVLRYVYGILSL
jgi:hypothetical protein